MESSVLRIAVGSTNPVKVGAVFDAVQEVLRLRNDDRTVVINEAAVSSGVSAQPYSDEETRIGAENRARLALESDASAELGFGLEGGLMPVGDELQSVVWVSLIDRSGRKVSFSGNKFAIPAYIAEQMNGSDELGTIMDTIEGKKNTNQAGGMFGYLTEGVVPRQKAYANLVEFAMALYLSERY